MERLNVCVGQPLWAVWDECSKWNGEKLNVRIPVKVKSLDDGVITVVEDREDNALDFNRDGTLVLSDGMVVRLVNR